MKGLVARLLVSLGAAALIGLLVSHAGFIVATARALSIQRTLETEVALFELAARLNTADDPIALAQELATEHHVVMTLIDRAGGRLATAALPTQPHLNAPGSLVEGGYEHVAIELTHVRFALAIASRLRLDVLDALLREERDALLVLTLSAALSVAFGLWFLRRPLVRPLLRMNELVGRQDREALSHFGQESKSPLAQLGRGIIAMNQELADDREKMRGQLDELRTAHDALALAQQHLVRAERLAVVGRLSAGIAHEIGNPLAVVAGFVDLLRDPALSEHERKDALARMAKELDRMQGIVRGLLDFGRAARASDTAGELSAALGHVRGLLGPQLRSRTIELRWPDAVPVTAVGVSTDALTQLVLNLVLNAIDAVAAGGTIELALEMNNAFVTLTVEDSGPGVAQDLRERIFEPFFTTKPAGKGTGLGLAVCERIVSAAGGEIELCTSRLGGASFRVMLPRTSAAHAAGTHSSSATSA